MNSFRCPSLFLLILIILIRINVYEGSNHTLHHTLHHSLHHILNHTLNHTLSSHPTHSKLHHPHHLNKSIEINYEYLNVSKQLTDAIPCSSSEICEKKTFAGFQIPYSVMINNDKKILMEYTPKAGCTAAVTMFMNSMGFIQNSVYHVWPHLFREQYFEKRCGTANPCMYESDQWYRFKVVRNPYDRVVSSYIHIMKYAVLRDKVVPEDKRETMSFEQFVEHIKEVPTKVLQGLAGGHVAFQTQPYERKYFRSKAMTVFHDYVYSEKLEEGIERINNRTGGNFKKGDRGVHVVKRHNGTNYFVGNMSWHELKDKIPSDYGLFYNTRIQTLVHHVYIWDIEMYQYKFPFHIIS
jgi:hypothetical protein